MNVFTYNDNGQIRTYLVIFCAVACTYFYPYNARILQKMSFFYRRLGPLRALEYVNEQYRSLYKFKQGSVEDIRRRLQAKKELQEEKAVREDLGTGAASSTPTMPTGGGGY